MSWINLAENVTLLLILLVIGIVVAGHILEKPEVIENWERSYVRASVLAVALITVCLLFGIISSWINVCSEKKTTFISFYFAFIFVGSALGIFYYYAKIKPNLAS